MAIQLFWIYIGSLLACSIAVAVLVMKLVDGVAKGGKKPFIYGSLNGIAGSLVAYLVTLVSANLFTIFWFMGGIFLVLGLVHILFLHKQYFYAHHNGTGKPFIGELLFGLFVVLLSIIVFSSLQYFLKDRFFLFYPLVMSGLMFFVPVLISYCFNAAYTIPTAQYYTWQYPLYDAIDLPDGDEKERFLVIGFEIAKKGNDLKKTYFRARAPESMKLGDLFYHFINDYNDLHSETTIEYAVNKKDAYEWWFRSKPKWFQLQKVLHPGLSVRENGIRENSIIVCERILNHN